MHGEIMEASPDLGRSMGRDTSWVDGLARELASLTFPFAARKNHEVLDDVLRRNHAFLQGHGLLQSDVHQGLRDIVQYTTLLYPTAEDVVLNVVVDAITWSHLWRRDYARLCQEDAKLADASLWQLVDLTLHRVGIQPADEAPPLVWAFANLWKREAAGMSLAWQQRAATHWRRWFLSFAGEDLSAEYMIDANLSTHRPDLRGAECMVLDDLIEGSHKFELPCGAHESLELEGLRDIQADSMHWVSDIAAACAGRRSESSVVCSVQRQWDIGADQAIRKVIIMHEQLMQRWCRLRDRLPQLYATLHLDEDARIQLQRYVIAIESMIAGHHTWHAKAAGVSALARDVKRKIP
jgi:hypothetical protein